MSKLQDTDPPLDCPLCPRLVSYLNDARQKYPDWHNAPVPNWSAPSPRLMIVGLAPGLKGANRTGRPFTGDWAGDLLYQTLVKFDFAKGNYGKSREDGLELTDAIIVNAVRCVPPENKPIGAEINNCRPFLRATVEQTTSVQCVVALGGLATVLISMPATPGGWSAGGLRIVLGMIVGVGTILGAVQIRKKLSPGRNRGLLMIALLVLGFFAFRFVFYRRRARFADGHFCKQRTARSE